MTLRELDRHGTFLLTKRQTVTMPCILSIFLLSAQLATPALPEVQGAELRVEKQTTPSDEELLKAWQALSDRDRSDTIEWFLAECDNATHFRSTLERYVLSNFEGDPYTWPAAQDPPTFDPNEHTPALIIKRAFVDASRRGHAKKVQGLRGSWNEREMDVAFRYDWALGTIVSVQAWDHPERIARTAIAGFSPYSDLVEALVEMQLDAGDMREVAAVFGHAYSDRNGNAYRSVTLYDAWASGQNLEMPDVECLGIIHTLDDDWKTWKSPIPDSQHKRLYRHIGEIFAPLRRYRALRTSLARVFVQGSPKLPSGYEASLQRLHGLWELHVSEPPRLLEFLPEDKGWERWWKKVVKKVDKSKDIRERAAARQLALEESRAWTRRTFHGILKEYGAFDKDED